jgi:hypothetical protein
VGDNCLLTFNYIVIMVNTLLLSYTVGLYGSGLNKPSEVKVGLACTVPLCCYMFWWTFRLCLTDMDIQYFQKVFIPFDLFHILLCYSLNSKCIK